MTVIISLTLISNRQILKNKINKIGILKVKILLVKRFNKKKRGEFKGIISILFRVLYLVE